MRELTKSAFSFSWAMSVFGAQQLVNVFSPSRAVKAFDDVTRATEAELGDVFRSALRAGDAVQRGLVDMAFGWTASAGGDGRTTAHKNGGAAGSAVGSQPDDQISSAFPYESHYVDILGSRMHYIEAGSGSPILFLHGNPTWSYTWRNIIPHLSSLGRCIAPDLIGFGRSDKPRIDYRWNDHVRYLDAFIETMGVRDLTLVLHDQGSGLGFHYAKRHPHNVRAIAFFEAIVRPYPWHQFSTPEFREIFRQFRSGGVGGPGWQLIVEQNMFIEQLLPQAAGRPLNETEMNWYREPFRTLESRLPVWRFPRETPIGGEPADVWQAVSEYSDWLQHADIPKLMLYATPGALITQEHALWCQQNIRNLTSVHVGPGSHFLQESSPHRIGREVASWLARVRSTGRQDREAPLVASPIEAMRVQVAQMLDSLDQQMPIAAIVIFKVTSEREPEFMVEADRLTAATRRLPGCNVFAFHKLAASSSGGREPVEYLIYEDWETTHLFQAQWHSEHLQNFQSLVGDFVAAPPDLRFYVGWREYRGALAHGAST
jgi:haloalkane dehalogenase